MSVKNIDICSVRKSDVWFWTLERGGNIASLGNPVANFDFGKLEPANALKYAEN